MRAYQERVGVLGPTYGLFGCGLTNIQITEKLNLTDATVRSCTWWMLHYLNLRSREELVTGRARREFAPTKESL